MGERRAATRQEARALANPLRLRILRLCLDEALTNRQLADRLGMDPATVLHHVRTLVDTGFLAAEPLRRGTRGAREKPYRVTGKSWSVEVGDATAESLHLAMVDAFRDELLEGADPEPTLTRMAARLTAEDRRELAERLEALAEEFRARDDPDGEPVGMLFAVHRRR